MLKPRSNNSNNKFKYIDKDVESDRNKWPDTSPGPELKLKHSYKPFAGPLLNPDAFQKSYRMPERAGSSSLARPQHPVPTFAEVQPGLLAVPKLTVGALHK